MQKPFILGPVIVAALLAAPAGAATASLTRAWQFQPADAAALAVDNLLGDVAIEAATDGGFHVTATIRTEAGSQADADALARAVDFRTEDAGPRSRFQVLLPEASFPVIHDPKAARGSWFGRTYVDYLGERRELSRDARKAVQVRVDLTVRVPEGMTVGVNNRLGSVHARGVVGRMAVDTARGPISARDGRGPIELDTGSGAIEVANHEGDVEADTGSGAISVSGCRCRIEADTGSGSITVTTSAGELDADTGSGRVVVEGFAGPVTADTGSGSVTINGLTAGARLDVDTGSGSVRVEGDLGGLEDLDVETGSGGVTLRATALPSMVIRMATGSGGIDADVQGGALRTEGRRSAELTVGDGRYKGRIRTGCGGIRIEQAPAPDA